MTPQTPPGAGVDRPPSTASSRQGSVSSTTNRFRAAAGGQSQPRPSSTLRESRLNAIRANSNQPSYNLFEATSNRSPSLARARQSNSPASNPSPDFTRAMTGDSSKENVAPPDAEEYESQRLIIETQKAQISELRYTVDNANAAAEIKQIEQDSELRKARQLAELEFKKKQEAEGDRNAALRQVDQLQNELHELRAAHADEKAELEKRARAAEDQARLLREQLDDVQAAKDEAARLQERKIADLDAQIQKDANSIAELQETVQANDEALEAATAQLNEKDTENTDLEAQVIRLKAQTGDAETMAIIRRELSEQVAHIRNLEATNRDQLTELRHLRQSHKVVGIVEEEKASLKRKLEDAETTKAELATERRQRERLEAEHFAWAAYLEREGQAEFNSPEDVARALVQERYNAASLLDRIGSIQSQLVDKDAVIQDLQQAKSEMASQMERLSSTGGSSAEKVRMRLERQRALADKEVKLLRDQLKMYESDITLQPGNLDEKKAERINVLETLLDESRAQIKDLESQISALESSSDGPAAAAGRKRPAPDDQDSPQHEQVGQLTRKNRTLQDDLDLLKTKYKVIEKELSVARDQLEAARRTSSVRILELQDNPTAKHSAAKQSSIDELRTENQDLRKLIHDSDTGVTSCQSVPVSTLVALQREIQIARDETASAVKRYRRLKEIFMEKSDEFKEAVFSLLGWHVTFIPKNKMRVESVYYGSETDEHERAITFDGERGSMKFGGGPTSAFAETLKGEVEYWVRTKKCIPGFLAAVTLKLYELAVEEGRVVEP
ncbi:unnamed protein product [Discula destructiva]